MHKNRNKKGLWTNIFIWSFICAVSGFAVCLAVLVLFSVLLYYTTDVIKSFTVFSSVSLIVGSFSGGFMCGLCRRRNGLYEGIFCGFIIYLLLLIIGVIYFHSFENLMSILKFLLCVIPSAAGGVIGVNHKRPRSIKE